MNCKSLFIFLLSLASTAVLAKERVEELCPRFTLRGHDKIELKEAERLLVCGDPKNPSWNNIPDNQATFHLKTFLQARGYHDPKFSAGKPGQIIVDIGEPTRVKVFRTEGDDPHFDITRFRHIVGEVITPSLLDETKTRMKMRMQAIGFACPEIDMQAATETGELVARVKTGPFQNLVGISREPVEGINSEIFSRYDAHKLDVPYNNDYLAITVHRIMDQGVVQSAYFTTACSEEKGATVVEKFVPGPPRLVAVGFGLNTEQLVQVRASWKNSRLWSTASTLEVAAIASLKRQELSSTLSWYVLPEPSRFYLRPFIGLKHENVEQYENLTAQFRFAPAWTEDSRNIGYSFNFGPTLNLTRTVRGTGPSFAKFLSLAGELRVTDHYYEFYRGSPRQGFDWRVEGNFTENNVLSNVTANLVRVGFENLWNISSFDPPAVVIGLRGRLGTTLTNQDTSSNVLPTDFRHFLGGSTDLRGFGLREMPGTDGSLTALYLGIESRFNDLLPLNIQPILFVDGAVFSQKAFSIDGPVVYSPGAGVRFESKIGVIRTTLSKGIFARQAGLDPKRSHWQFYFSFGEEF